MSKLDILNLKGEKVKDTKLNDNVFGVEPNDSVIYDAVFYIMHLKDKVLIQQRQEVKYLVVEENHGDKKELVMQDKVVSELYNGVMVE